MKARIPHLGSIEREHTERGNQDSVMSTKGINTTPKQLSQAQELLIWRNRQKLTACFLLCVNSLVSNIGRHAFNPADEMIGPNNIYSTCKNKVVYLVLLI